MAIPTPRSDKYNLLSIPLFRPVVPATAKERVAQVLDSPWIGLGPVTEEFEAAFAEKIGARHVVAVNSGTAALHLALRLMGIGPGDEVILPANTFVATGHAVLYEQAVPVFADIDPSTGNIDPEHIRTLISPRTAAVIAVHYAGAVSSMDEIRALARQAGIAVLEDCAHACGARYRDRPLGELGTFQAYSFQATKNLATGEGGALVVPTEHDAVRGRRIRRLGIGHRNDASTVPGNWDYAVDEVGFKYNMSDIQAAIGLAQLDVLDEVNAARARLAAHYARRLASMPGVRTLNHPHTAGSSNFLMPVMADDRDGLMAALEEAGVGTGVHFRRIDSYPMYKLSDLPHTDWFWRHQLSLPMHSLLTHEDVDYICDVIESTVRKGKHQCSQNSA
ncbi:DegT/DnrJ/EryC1/StrS family aminotransferase [Streptomyces sp. MNU76]|uniref:DegT/DnrJ/EryC1/StrS family aminotransferase n=1 Tax=Streptomyces sp. MNU76 TaxID=2560026 RepID=UPI001E5EDD33|nr:DegT/DnrJ/EryC1/StrS family aminotransferase [Streptomyces sp. MNU76]MCC9711769.1 DegT/DnrJ/EryC1/StrS family aminotransferase [Streptomyces sp. MNU76]